MFYGNIFFNWLPNVLKFEILNLAGCPDPAGSWFGFVQPGLEPVFVQWSLVLNVLMHQIVVFHVNG